MEIVLALVGQRAPREPFESVLDRYLERARPYADVRLQTFRSEEAFFGRVSRERGRIAPWTVLLDRRGQELSSERLAARLKEVRLSGRQRAIFAIGPADGWSEPARSRAEALLSLGPMTLAHELAAIVLAEQIYRAFTILAGHPYHKGH